MRLLNNSVFNAILTQKPIGRVAGVVIQSVAMNPEPMNCIPPMASIAWDEYSRPDELNSTDGFKRIG